MVNNLRFVVEYFADFFSEFFAVILQLSKVKFVSIHNSMVSGDFKEEEEKKTLPNLILELHMLRLLFHRNGLPKLATNKEASCVQHRANKFDRCHTKRWNKKQKQKKVFPRHPMKTYGRASRNL